MRHYLIDPAGKYWKANLHCHSTVSDGRYTPQELKDYFMANGYSILAYTDHDVLITHPELRSPDFLPLNGYEMEINDHLDYNGPFDRRRCCHICLISPEENDPEMICWHRRKYTHIGNAKNYVSMVKKDENAPDYNRYHTHAGINDILKQAHDKGFFVTYNHPCWSLETAENYTGFRYFNAMEIVNYGCWVSGYSDCNPEVYDEMLREGMRLYPVAADDCHGGSGDFAYKGFCGGWVMINSPELEYSSVMKSLFAGDFYASTGPEIYEIYIEDEKIHVRCSPARMISIQKDIRECRSRTPVPGREEFVTETEFALNRSADWFRITVTDDSGCSAYSRAFFTEDLPADTSGGQGE